MYMVEEYVNASKFQYRDALEVIEEFEKEISEMRGKCVDIGCGPGNVTKTLLLPKLAPEAELVGADISKNMVDYAREKCAGEKRLSFICLDIETENLPKELVHHFDSVFSFFCLHWCQSPRKAFNNICKMMRPGGTALTMFLAHHNGFDAYKHLYDNPLYRPYMQDMEHYVPCYHECNDQRSALRKILEETGFEVLHCSKRQRNYIHQNRQALKNHITAVNPFVTRLPENLRDEFIELTTQEVIKQKIIFKDQNDCPSKEEKILDMYETFIAYVRKPLDS
ncbi:juvenile hormone acid methyltransferase [Halictus rubicundus]|uniref:juvenile hormone acid methyltransferase n=1 Tax=Halictus rubicundus TaxID=77578 RepID=UPI004036E320